MLDALLRAEGVERGRAAVPGGPGGDPRRAFGARGGVAVRGVPASGRSGPPGSPGGRSAGPRRPSGPELESRARAWWDRPRTHRGAGPMKITVRKESARKHEESA